MIDFHPLLSAFQTVRRELLALRVPKGYWVGELSSSAFATAGAASALCLVAKAVKEESRRDAYQQLAGRSVDWLVAGQNGDGGWGDTRSSPSNLAATMLVRAAIHLAAQSQRYADSLARAQRGSIATMDWPGCGGSMAAIRRCWRPFSATRPWPD